SPLLARSRHFEATRACPLWEVKRISATDCRTTPSRLFQGTKSEPRHVGTVRARANDGGNQGRGPTGTPWGLIFYSRSQSRYSALTGAFPTASAAVFLPKGRSRLRSASTGGEATARSVPSPPAFIIIPL